MLPWNHLPFNEEMKKKFNNMNPNDIDKYVQNMITKMFPKDMEGMLNPQEWLKGVTSLNIRYRIEQGCKRKITGYEEGWLFQSYKPELWFSI